MSDERTEKPTPRRRKEARKDGQVPRSQDVGAWASVLVFAMLAGPLVRTELEAIAGIMARSLRLLEQPETSRALELLGDAMTHALMVLVVLGSGVLLVGVAGAVSQGGFYIAARAMKPSFAKLNPLQGAKRIFGLQALWQGVNVLVKASVVAVLVWLAIRAMMPLLGGLVPPGAVLELASGNLLAMLRNVAVAGVLMAVADHAFQRRRIGKQIRMSKHDIAQEHKQAEGDPLVKSAIRSHQLAMARSRMIADVPTADVVLVNPTHIAVALRYEPDAGAPRVVARGAGVVAARIREAATEARVPVVRDVPLARALHASCRVGQQIPPELFAAVAQVLAFVISRRRTGSAAGEHTTPRDDVPLPEVPRRRPMRRARVNPPVAPTDGQ